VALRATEWLCSRSHSVSAGVVACLVHDGLSNSVWTRCPRGQRVAIVEQSTSFLRAVPPDGRELLARGKLVHHGPEFLVSSAEVVDADGNRVALGSQTSVLIDPGRYEEPKAERVLATVLFTDIVESTNEARELGDERWRQLLADHDGLVRRQLQIHKGREVKTTGDGFLARFESPGLAVQCARAIRDGIRRLGLEIRAGIHTGECEAIDGDVRGIAVHLAARVQAAAEPGEILVSSTVCDLVSGSGIRFVDRGLHELKGIEGKRQLLAVED
jgi:class 3 adenylate cyclase